MDMDLSPAHISQIPYGWITTWHCGDMTRMALDMYTILPAPPTINSSLVDGQVLPAPPTINSSLVDWQAQDAISAPTRIVITLQLINHLGTKYQ